MLTITALRLDNGNWGEEPRQQLTDQTAPVFSWAAVSDVKGDKQAAYCAAVCEKGTVLWNSGWVETAEQSCTYAGAALPADKPLTFTVQIRSQAGEQAVSAVKRFYYVCGDTAPVWIGDPSLDQSKDVTPVRWFHCRFTPDKPVEAAVLYVAGAGFTHVKLNGQEADPTAQLDPAMSDYNHRCYAAVLPELRPLLVSGENHLQVALANGWRHPEDAFFWEARRGTYEGFLGNEEDRNFFFGDTALTAALHLLYTDGTDRWIRTDTAWTCSQHPCVRAQLYNGETWDARVDTDSEWPAAIVPGPKAADTVKPMTLPPTEIHEVYRPLSVSLLAPDTYVFDFGQNIAGVCRLRLPRTLKPGQRLRIHHGEELAENGDLFKGNLRGAECIDEYIAVGDGSDAAAFMPQFVYHGFRYVKVEGLTYISPEDIEALCLRTVVPSGGFFRSGSPALTAVHEAVVHTEEDNMISMLTDCPQRDERMGWMNDATVRFEETPYNFDIGRIFPKVLEDIRDQQGEDGSITCTAPFVYGFRPADPVCTSYLVLGEQSYLFAGNETLLRRAYEGFEQWEQCLAGLAKDHIITYTQYGDWASPVYACIDGDKSIDAVHSKMTPNALMSTGYYYYNAVLLAKFAGWLGYADKQAHYEALSEEIKAAMLKEWWHPETATMATGSQGAQSFALWLGIIPEEYRQAAADRIHEDLVKWDYRFTTGNLCTRYLMDALTQYGYVDDAYALLTREEYPSIGFMLQQEGTTVWERMELKKEPGMNSHNHPMYGSVDNWMFAYAAGIRPTAKAFDRVRIAPVYPTRLQSVHTVLHTVKGDLTVRWIKRYGKTELRVQVPFGTTADIVLPDRTETVGSGLWCYLF